MHHRLCLSLPPRTEGTVGNGDTVPRILNLCIMGESAQTQALATLPSMKEHPVSFE